jgi:hypothetical protein
VPDACNTPPTALSVPEILELSSVTPVAST